MSHAFLAPSSAHIWGSPSGCRAAPMVQAQYPEREESDAAREGTAAHELAAVHIEHALRALPAPSGRVGQAASNGTVFTDEMVDAAKLYADDVRAEAIARGVFGGESIGVESKVLSDRIHALNNGTPDFWMNDRRNRTLLIWDFKFGFEPVDAFENWQLMNYAALLLDKLGINGALEQGYTLVLKVVQPRCFRKRNAVDAWTVAASDLRPFWNDMAQGAVESLDPNAPARPGRHCLHCSGRHACGALMDAAGAAMDYAQAVTTHGLDENGLALELRWLNSARDLIKARLSGLEEEGLHRINQGKVIPGYALQASYGHAKWKDPEQVLGIGTAYGLDLRRKEPLTPGQAKKEGLPEDVVKHFSYRPMTGHKLKPVKSNEAKKVFSQ